MMASGAYPAYFCDDGWQFLDRPAFAEFLEPPELGDLEIRILDFSLVIEEDLDLSMALKPGYGINADVLHSTFLPKMEPGRL